MEYYAHSLDGTSDSSKWQKLETHLTAVASLASEYASSFQCERIAYIIGLLHDLGKFSREFQEYLHTGKKNSDPTKRDHATAGAQLVNQLFSPLGYFCAYMISGHHSGLLNTFENSAGCLDTRLAKEVADWKNPESEQLVAKLKAFGLTCQDLPPTKDLFSLSLLGRMLYSCLTDADCLDTERFKNPAIAQKRPKWEVDILSQMNDRLDLHLAKFVPDNPVRHLRAQVLDECRNAAERTPGIFTLTVPTGGGKTYSSLAFALRHAVKYRKKRIIYVIPFISIIEQNAEKFREVFSDMTPDPVLEVHSNIGAMAAKEKAEDDPENLHDLYRRLASENFDAPLVVTTAVQFYESLMGNSSSQCRKLHNFADSVIILDEVQKIPVCYLKVILHLFQDLSTLCRSSLVLCTATQPAIKWSEDFSIGLQLPHDREIIHDPSALSLAMKRVNVIDLGKTTDSQLLERFRSETSFLCIVNTKKHAAALFHSLDHRDGDFHLSTSMVPAHRLKVLKKIRERLTSKLPCRLISTALVEAGVDLDFPVVFRSLAGSDSIAQAAGRCNREGLLLCGSVYVFQSEHFENERFMKDEINCGSNAMQSFPDDPLSLEAIDSFFQHYFYDKSGEWDRKKILQDFQSGNKQAPLLFNYADAAKKFKLIEEDTLAIVVPYQDEDGDENGQKLCEELRQAKFPDFEILRRLQPYTIQMRKDEALKHIGREIELWHDEIHVLASLEKNYNKDTGLFFEK